ncbi:MAG: hypothetical protein IKV16_04035, partial [Clostridia bacterium]|nr:hypothetical protein [Clostridia bacterium]
MKRLKLISVFVLLASVIALTTACTGIPFLQTCTVHRDLNKDTVCDICGSYTPIVCVNHKDANHDGMCDTTGCTITFQVFHYDLDHDGHCDEELCTKSNMRVNHVDDDYNRRCDECGKKFTIDCDCYDDDEDGFCDECDYEILPCEHIDEDEDGYCDECDEEIKEPCDECVDSDGDEKCDECGGKVEAPKVCEHTDGNFDGKCDLCKEAMTGVIQMYADKQSNFKFIIPANATSDTAYRVDMLIKDLKSYGITVEKGEDTAEAETEYEVFFGTPVNRAEEYKLDGHDYGVKGYAVKLVGTKIIIVSGSEKTFTDAVDSFKESFLGITSSTRSLTTRYISEAQNVTELQDDYDVSTITLLGENIKGYTIAVDSKDTNTYPTALSLQEILYTRTGYWLKIVPLEEADKSIVISMAKKNPEKDGFYATFTEGRMEFTVEYPTVVQTKIIGFFTTALSKAKQTGTLAIEASDSFTTDVRYVYYSDYGAKGDGYTDDSEAIRAAHTYANLGGHKVIAGDSKTYYIGRMDSAILIKTDVDWGTAKFILDDASIKPTDSAKSVQVFLVDGSSSVSVNGIADLIKRINAAGGIDASTFTTFDFNFGRKFLVRVYNNKHQNYIRYGVNANSGATQQEVILVDENGNLDPTTPLMFDFEQVSSLVCYPTDEEPITIEGGTFYTSPYLQDTETVYSAYARGIRCGRSNTTFKNIKHFLENEGDYNQSDHRYKGSSVDYGYPYG